jgi:hypothetical protein
MPKLFRIYYSQSCNCPIKLVTAVIDNNLGPYSKYFIFFLTYECAQQARALHYTCLKKLPSDQNLKIIRAFLSYKENEVLCIWPLVCLTLVNDVDNTKGCEI